LLHAKAAEPVVVEAQVQGPLGWEDLATLSEQLAQQGGLTRAAHAVGDG
jgi:hypothetical protein